MEYLDTIGMGLACFLLGGIAGFFWAFSMAPGVLIKQDLTAILAKLISYTCNSSEGSFIRMENIGFGRTRVVLEFGKDGKKDMVFNKSGIKSFMEDMKNG